MDSMTALMTIHQCKSATELPGAVARFERDVDAYEKRTQRPFPIGVSSLSPDGAQEPRI